MLNIKTHNQRKRVKELEGSKREKDRRYKIEENKKEIKRAKVRDNFNKNKTK